MDKMTAIFKALSDRNRLRIVSALLMQNELCACQVTELIQVTGATASRHMGVLISSGLVESRKDGRWVYYRVRREQADTEALISWIKSRLNSDSDIESDSKRLQEIVSCEPQNICKRQRGNVCC